MLVGGSCHDIKPQNDASPSRRDVLDLAAVFWQVIDGKDHAQPNQAPRQAETVPLGHGRVVAEGLPVVACASWSALTLEVKSLMSAHR